VIELGKGPTISFEADYRTLRSFLLTAPHVDVGEWHAMDISGKKELVSRELRSVTFRTAMPADQHAAVGIYEPNMPWAEKQFQERVSGVPLNPGETYKEWPWQSKMSDHRGMEKGKFSHTYMERYWPQHAGLTSTDARHIGIRYRYGDLSDLVDLLARSPYSRQAVLPVWFPEDTGGVHGGRLPCSLTYHFLLRDNRLHCDYSIRSCDFVRHFRDDVYMTARLVQWVISQMEPHFADPEVWANVKPGTLTMHIGSLHIFEGDVPKLKGEANDDLNAAFS
jgi:thymidylate synthase